MQKDNRIGHLTNSRKEYLSALAEYLAEYFFKEDEPILPEVIAKAYNITYSYGNYQDCFDGLIEHKNGRFHIFINQEKHNIGTRHRFSFAHELGHFFIDEHAMALASGLVVGHPSVAQKVTSNIAEKEADYFAACLLMPRNRILKSYKTFKNFQFNFIEYMAQHFTTSIPAALYRFLGLHLHPIMIIRSKDKIITSRPMRNEGFHYTLRSNNVLPDESNAMTFYKSGRDIITTTRHYASDWFFTETYAEINEHCIYYRSRNSVLSILWSK